jgi:hypothetical protein
MRVSGKNKKKGPGPFLHYIQELNDMSVEVNECAHEQRHEESMYVRIKTRLGISRARKMCGVINVIQQSVA